MHESVERAVISVTDVLSARLIETRPLARGRAWKKSRRLNIGFREATARAVCVLFLVYIGSYSLFFLASAGKSNDDDAAAASGDAAVLGWDCLS